MSVGAFAQEEVELTQTDTIIHVSKSEILILEDTIYAPESDTFFIVKTYEQHEVEDNPYKTAEEFYEKIRTLSKDNKITAKLFDLLFVTSNFGKETIDADKEKNTSNTPFIPYEGLIIHDIKIKYVDIISGEVTDTAREASRGLVKLANKLHTDTWKSVIMDNLLVEKGQKVNPYRLADSERLLRRLAFIEDARIYIYPNHLSGTAELIVVIQDRFAWGVAGGYSSLQDYRAQIYNRNVAGWGRYASGTYFYDKSHPDPHGYEVQIGGQNIQGTISDWSLNRTDVGERESWQLKIDKEFITPQIKYGGGIDLASIEDSTINFEGEELQNGFYNLNYQDVWLGRSFVLDSESERKNLIFTGRFINRHFDNQPEVSPDSNSIYYNRQMLLGEVTLASQQYMRSDYILSFGITEDVPVGYRYSLIFGTDFNQFYRQNYYGFQFFWSVHINNFGFLLFNQRVGSFDRKRERNSEIEGVNSTAITYYSPLVQVKRYRIRNSINLSYTAGFHQPLNKGISLEDRLGIEGRTIYGNSVFTSSIESVIFTPWYFYGFRFAPYVYFNYGKVWDYRQDNDIKAGYTNIGGGFRIRNESLVINTFEFRITHFLSTPSDTRTTNFEFSFSIPLAFGRFFRYKPELLPFR